MNSIVAVDEHWGIGCRNHLLVSIPADMRYFQEVTTGGVIIAGRKTLESFPGGKPLKNRVNIVLTRQKEYALAGAVVTHSVEEVLEAVKDFPEEKVFVVGGESIYHQFLPYCREIHMTRIRFSYEADRFFPDITATGEWELSAESEEQTYYDLEYVFQKYHRITGGNES